MEQPNNGCEFTPASTGVTNFNDSSYPSPQNSPMYPELPPQYPQPVKQAPAKPPLVADRRDVLFALLFFICGYLFIQFIFNSLLGFGVTVFTILFTSLSFFYLQPKEKLPKGAGSCLLTMALASLPFSLFSNYAVQFWNLLFLMACAVYLVAILAGTRATGRFDASFITDLINHGLLTPFSNFFCNIRVLLLHKSKHTKTIAAVLAGVLIAVPILAIIIPQLTRADAAFEAAASDFLGWMQTYLIDFVLWLPLSFLVACYLFGLLYGSRHRHNTNKLTQEKAQSLVGVFQKLSSAVFGTTLTLICAVYVLFLLVTASELFPVLLNGPSDAFSYSDYARRGFFELCGLSAFNLLIMAAAWLFTHRKSKRLLHQRILFSVLSVETILLIVTAIGKMLLYVGRFGLTEKRIETLWFMSFLFLLFLLILCAQFFALPVVRVGLGIFCASFIVLCYLNIGGLTVRYNIAAYESGSLPSLDTQSLYQAPTEAFVPVAELYPKLTDKTLKEELSYFLLDTRRTLQMQQTSWKNQNVQSLIALHTPLPEEISENYPGYTE